MRRGTYQWDTWDDVTKKVDKTGIIEKGIERFPSLYIMGAACTGKTTAVRMFLDHHREFTPVVLWADEEDDDVRLLEELEELEKRMEKEKICLVVENLFEKEVCLLSLEVQEKLRLMIRHLGSHSKVIVIGREHPPVCFLEMVWKGEMELCTQENFHFNREDIRMLMDVHSAHMDVEELYRITGGWPGYTVFMIHFAKMKDQAVLSDLEQSYEVRKYIRFAIFDALSKTEQRVVYVGGILPWLNLEILELAGYGEEIPEVLEGLCWKGIFTYDSGKQIWEIATMFKRRMRCRRRLLLTLGDLKEKEPDLLKASRYYEERGFIREALDCLELIKNKEEYKKCLIKYYDRIPFIGVPLREEVRWTDESAESCYLRGMRSYFHMDFGGMRDEIRKVREMTCENEFRRKEILLNLCFADPAYPMKDWIDLLESFPEKGFRLYDMLGGSCSYLCGLKDLTELFACSKKDENRMKRVWEEKLVHQNIRAYHIAQIDYYIETERMDQIDLDEYKLLRSSITEFRVVGLYLLCKIQRIRPMQEIEEVICLLERILTKCGNVVYERNADAVSSLYAPVRKDHERFVRWLRNAGPDLSDGITEANYLMFCAKAKGYVLLYQYEQADKILKRLIPYLKVFKRNRFLAEALFEQAIIDREKGKNAVSLKSIMASFALGDQYRYVELYTGYGAKGAGVIEEYMDWLKKTLPEGWVRKKKYNYGNVLRMPREDYMETVLRRAKQEAKVSHLIVEQPMEEKLTMMETVVLQAIGRGLTNAEIGEELDLKLSTVKTHIYNIYKKLEVKNRTQAVKKGKEKGILN